MVNTEIGQTDRIFSLAEAQSVFPLVQAITQKHKVELEPQQLRLNKILANDPRRPRMENEYQAVVRRWRTKIEQLGATVTGLWVVEFNMGEGGLSWRHPELSLHYFRPRHAVFSDRVPLAQYIDEHDPDWAR